MTEQSGNQPGSQPEFTTVDDSEMFASASTAYVPAPTLKLLKFHVVPFEKTEQVNNFKTLPSGDPNPDYGTNQPVLIFKAMLDSDVPGKGQVYSSWITGFYRDGKPVYSMGEKSKLGKIAEALVGSVESFQKLNAGDIVGLPFQCALVPGKKNPEKLVLNIDKIMPPADDQERVTTDTVVTEVPDDAQAEDALLAAVDAFGGAKEVQ